MNSTCIKASRVASHGYITRDTGVFAPVISTKMYGDLKVMCQYLFFNQLQIAKDFYEWALENLLGKNNP